MTLRFPFEEVAHLPAADDNCAVATTRLEPGTQLETQKGLLQLDHTVLEGHRFAVCRIAEGQALSSWGMPFGYASSEIQPGSYVSNRGTLEELERRQIDFPLPSRPNFEDHYRPYRVHEESFRSGRQVPLCSHLRSFEGYSRGEFRGVGTRNYIVILATNSRAGSYARSLAISISAETRLQKGIDGIVAVAHTEAGAIDRPNNMDQILRTLAGFVVHPNVGGVLILDEGPAWVSNGVLRQYMRDHGYPLEEVLHQFLTLDGDFPRKLDQGRRIVTSWLEIVAAEIRRPQPLQKLKVALQCGGSDSFSGLSANPLLGLVAKKILQNGGSANLAETNELVGAESYILSNVKDLKTAYQFIFRVEDFKHLMKFHGHTPEQNPSGGNLLRGLYNIALKSLGAAQKKHPEVRLDYVIDYAEPMVDPGYYFMNSPGNDLESIAGQVASGANLIFFSTGNGSITNFPFVPTLKVMSTTRRYRLMPNDMDINAGAHLDGVPLDLLAEEMFERTIKVASSRLTQGERAGHSQVSIWRNWEQTDTANLTQLIAVPEPVGAALELNPVLLEDAAPQRALSLPRDCPQERLGLVLPNSLCSSEVARMLSDRLNRIAVELSLSRVVSLSHTEGCGAVRGPSQELLVRTLIGYMTHSLVDSCVLLEHGCENVHHQYLRRELLRRGLSPDQFGWVSIQLDGGIEEASRKVEDWFRGRAAADRSQVAPQPISIGILTSGSLPASVVTTLVDFTTALLCSEVNVVVPEKGPIGSCQTYLEKLGIKENHPISLKYAAPMRTPGFHIMETPSNHWVELLTGLGATGVRMVLAYIAEGSRQGHPFVPVVQFSSPPSPERTELSGLDLVLSGPPSVWFNQLQDIVAQTLSGAYLPSTLRSGDTDIQIPRGPWGFSV